MAHVKLCPTPFHVSDNLFLKILRKGCQELGMKWAYEETTSGALCMSVFHHMLTMAATHDSPVTKRLRSCSAAPSVAQRSRLSSARGRAEASSASSASKSGAAPSAPALSAPRSLNRSPSSSSLSLCAPFCRRPFYK